jgi:hypothetical protein
MTIQDLPASFPAELRLDNLTSAKEKTYFKLAVLVSLLVWIGLAVTIIGAVYAAVIGFMLWIGHGLLAAYLRSETMRVSERQFPELHATFLAVCQQLNCTKPPRLYVLQAGGAFNALPSPRATPDAILSSSIRTFSRRSDPARRR